TPAPVEPSGAKGRRRKGPGRTDYLLCVQVGDMPKPLPVAVLEAKRESEDPLKGMQQPKSTNFGSMTTPMCRCCLAPTSSLNHLGQVMAAAEMEAVEALTEATTMARKWPKCVANLR
ncbi:MAG: hypothetical protein Q7T07_16345, partial [Burkholderiaceae bacterium]|nr:hypothetical protein [Burkholderiaceae bacterium]